MAPRFRSYYGGMLELLPLGAINMPNVHFTASSTVFVNNNAIEAAVLVKGV
jgi:hypothetical protein